MDVLIGIDDTDMPDTRGTNQLAREIVRRCAAQWRCVWIVRHQLLDDPRVPYTSKNGSASIRLNGVRSAIPALISLCRETMQDWFVAGSDPGLCVAEAEGVAPAVVAFGQICQREIVTLEAAQRLAEKQGVHLEGLGGTHVGMIGALAAVGLGSAGDSGRIVQWRQWPDDLCGECPVADVLARDIEVRMGATGATITAGTIDVGKHLRPNLRSHTAQLFVTADPERQGRYSAIKLV